MNNISPSPEEIGWITLKEAARMVGCSIKTIRRRIKGGTWRSRIEYQGQKAIRLVAREDVVKESTALERFPPGTPEGALALQALDGLPRQLGEVLHSYLANLKTELDRRALYSRIYLLVVIGLTAILLAGTGFYFSRRRGEILESRIGAMSRTLSTTLALGQAHLGEEVSRISSLAAGNRVLAEEAREDSTRRNRSLETLLNSINRLEDASREARQDGLKMREEVAALRRELARREDLLRGRENAAFNNREEVAPEDEETTPEEGSPPTAVPEPPPEKKTSRFLGIF